MFQGSCYQEQATNHAFAVGQLQLQDPTCPLHKPKLTTQNKVKQEGKIIGLSRSVWLACEFWSGFGGGSGHRILTCRKLAYKKKWFQQPRKFSLKNAPARTTIAPSSHSSFPGANFSACCTWHKPCPETKLHASNDNWHCKSTKRCACPKKLAKPRSIYQNPNFKTPKSKITKSNIQNQSKHVSSTLKKLSRYHHHTYLTYIHLNNGPTTSHGGTWGNRLTGSTSSYDFCTLILKWFCMSVGFTPCAPHGLPAGMQVQNQSQVKGDLMYVCWQTWALRVEI